MHGKARGVRVLLAVDAACLLRCRIAYRIREVPVLLGVRILHPLTLERAQEIYPLIVDRQAIARLLCRAEHLRHLRRRGRATIAAGVLLRPARMILHAVCVPTVCAALYCVRHRQCRVTLRSNSLTTDGALHIPCRRRSIRARRLWCIESIARRSRTAVRRRGRHLRMPRRTPACARHVRRTAAPLHLREHGDIRLRHREPCLLLGLGTFQRAFQSLTPLLDPRHLIVEIGILLLQILLVHGRKLLPIPQLLADQTLALRIAFCI